MKIAILALIYLAAPALMVPDPVSLPPASTAKHVTVIYKSPDNVIPAVVDEEECDEVVVDFAVADSQGLRRYTMLRAD